MGKQGPTHTQNVCVRAPGRPAAGGASAPGTSGKQPNRQTYGRRSRRSPASEAAAGRPRERARRGPASVSALLRAGHLRAFSFSFSFSWAFVHRPPFTSVHQPRDGAGSWGRVGSGVHPWFLIQAVAQSLMPTGGPCGERSSDRAPSRGESPPPTSRTLRFLIYKTQGSIEESFSRALSGPPSLARGRGFQN